MSKIRGFHFLIKSEDSSWGIDSGVFELEQ